MANLDHVAKCLRAPWALACLMIWVMGFPSINICASSPCEPVRIVALGDSTTFGYSVEGSYPRQLARRLDEQGIAAVVINSGVNGDTTTGAQRRFEQEVLRHQPDIVVIQFGLNDQTVRFYQRPEEVPSYVTEKQFADNLRQFIAELRNRNAKVVLMTPNPMCWTPTLELHYPRGPYLDPPRGGNHLLQKYVDVVRRVAKEEQVSLIDIFQAYLDVERTSSRAMQELFLEDGVHPNERGYALNVQLLMPLILSMVEQRAYQQSGVGTLDPAAKGRASETCPRRCLPRFLRRRMTI